LEFNVPFQHKYGYIRDDNSASDANPAAKANYSEFHIIGYLV